MFSESKIIEIYCMENDFLQEICVVTSKICGLMTRIISTGISPTS